MNLENFLTGFFSGLVSGFIVAIVMNRIEKRRETELFWERYLWDSLKYCGIPFPVNEINNLKPFQKDSEFAKAIFRINDILNPIEDEELDEKQVELYENFIIAYKEYIKWKKSKFLRR